MQDVIDAIADPRRRQILRLVQSDELPAGAIAQAFGDVTRPAISQHLRVLREAGLLDERREGTRRLYRMRAAGLGDLRAFVEEFWDERLETLRRQAEIEERKQQNDHRGN